VKFEATLEVEAFAEFARTLERELVEANGNSKLSEAAELPFRRMQCKDIPDQPILEMLAKNPTKAHGWGALPLNLKLPMPPGTPPKLALAKMRMMIRRGVVKGCPCGCSSDFTITEKGLKEINYQQQ
jgi:hypothetical protein